jgi:feruloyl esterase
VRAMSLENRRLAFIASAVVASGSSLPAFATSTEAPVAACSALAKLAMPGATITSAESVGAGEYRMPQAAQGVFSRPGMNVAGRISSGPNPAFCRVAATLKPSIDSDIKIEVWLPQAGWNGKLLTAGNFGWGGSLMLGGMLTGLDAGYATASTDTGHDSNGGKFSLGHSEKLIDYAYRADHELTVDAKAIIKAFYGKGPTHAYWIGCSLGGLEGLIEAKRFPSDYDGIVAGAPPNPLTRFNALQLWPDYLISQQPNRLIPKEKYVMVHQAVLKACASPIGLKEGLVDAPDKCGFDPAQLEMYNFASGEAPSVALDLFRYAAFQNPDWDWKTMDWDKDVAAAIEKVGPLMHVDADLKPFIDRGGKLLLYIGWNDYHNPEQLIEYYKSVMKSGGGETARNSLRLFAIPGMGHCMGGVGCDTFDKLGAIDAWVARGEAPRRITAAKVDDGKIVRTSPLCAYPEVAKYKGTGDINDAASFACGGT